MITMLKLLPFFILQKRESHSQDLHGIKPGESREYARWQGCQEAAAQIAEFA